MAQYTTILANEFNTVRNTVATVLGTGSGTRGYGSPVTSYTVAAGNNIGVAEYTALTTDINRCYGHINGGSATLNSIVSGGTVTWANLVSYQVAATFIDNNRDTNGGAVTSSQTSKVLPAGWGNASGNRVATAIFNITFTDAEAKRYFFNQGSYITLSGSGQDSSGPSIKSNVFGALANGVSNTYNRTNYRTTGDPGTQSQYTGTSPYSLGGDPDGMFASIFAIGSNQINGSIQCRDKGGDGNVASNVLVDLTFYVNLLNISNTTGISPPTPTVSWQAWSYSA